MIRIMFHNLRHSVVRVFTKKNSGYITYFTLLESPPEEADDGRGNRQFHYFTLFGSPPEEADDGRGNRQFHLLHPVWESPGGGGRRAR